MEIKARRYLAIWWACPNCHQGTGITQAPPTKKYREYDPGECLFCNGVQQEVTRRRYYTVFASDFYSTAGTCKELCNIHFTNIRAFRKFMAERTAQIEKEAKEYFEHWRKIQEESEARLKKQREEAALLQEAKEIAHQSTQIAVLQANEIVQALWIEPEYITSCEDENDFPF